jgi:hypothetical protein
VVGELTFVAEIVPLCQDLIVSQFQTSRRIFDAVLLNGPRDCIKVTSNAVPTTLHVRNGFDGCVETGNNA